MGKFLLFIIAGVAAPAMLSAAVLSPTSYDMPNGAGVASSGANNYWDREYSGAGSTTTDHAPLSGGLGNLTDGVISAVNWDLIETVAGTGPYVGWRLNPLITFRFGGTVNLDSITFSLDDSNGNGGVSPPASIDIGLEGGPLTNHIVLDPAGSDPFQFTVSSLGLTGSSFDVRLNRNNDWVFASEVAFDGTPAAVPGPGSLALAIAGLAALALRRRLR